MNEISTKIRPALVSLEVGESMEFPIEKMKMFEHKLPNWE